jgi:hypothetical protein
MSVVFSLWKIKELEFREGVYTMKSTAIANSTGMQKFEFTAETATEVAALKA